MVIFSLNKNKDCMRTVSLVLFFFLSIKLIGQEFYSTKEHPEVKGLDISLYVPNGWEVIDPNIPNVVLELRTDTPEFHFFRIEVKDFHTFYSTQMSEKLLSEDRYVNELSNGFNKMGFKVQAIEPSKLKTTPILIFEGDITQKQMGVKNTLPYTHIHMLFEDKVIDISFLVLTDDIIKILDTINIESEI
jgi:hypothetical protein